METFQKATQEGDEWLVAQEVTSAAKKRERPQSRDQEETRSVHRPKCQVDASWAHNQSFFGGGFIMEMNDERIFSGSLGRRQVHSPLHAEFNKLMWAMSYSLRSGYINMTFESDFLQMVKLIEEKEVWPFLASE